MGQRYSRFPAAQELRSAGNSVPDSDSYARTDDEERLMLWEVSIARGCFKSFNRMQSAHAIVLSLLVTVNLVGFLQPPRGWDGSSRMLKSTALTIFTLFNSLSLYTATSGLLFYIYCSHSSIISLHSLPLPDLSRDESRPPHLLPYLRSSLHCAALPALRRRCGYLFSFLACSLILCMITYISAGIASTHPRDRVIGVILPAIPGWLCLFFLLHIAAEKLSLELDFTSRFEKLWSMMAPPNTSIRSPTVVCLDKAAILALDPLPRVLSLIYPRRNSDSKHTHYF